MRVREHLCALQLWRLDQSIDAAFVTSGEQSIVETVCKCARTMGQRRLLAFL